MLNKTASVGRVTVPGPITGDYFPAHPAACIILPPPPNLNCGDIPLRRFAVLLPDSHRFDGDNDGEGCGS